MDRYLGIKNIDQADSRTLKIVWTDDVESLFDVVELRRMCPCASCVDEWTKQRTINPSAIQDSVRPISVDSVGQYALQINYNDNHKTGIYTYKYLRELSLSAQNPNKQ